MFHTYQHADIRKSGDIVFAAQMKSGNYSPATVFLHRCTDARKKVMTKLAPPPKQSLSEIPIEATKDALEEYLSYNQCFSDDPMSALRYQVKYEWKTSIGPHNTMDSLDVQMELGMTLAMQAQWYNIAAGDKLKAAAMEWAKIKQKTAYDEDIEDSPESDRLKKEAYHCFTKAAGIYEFINENITPNILASKSPHPMDLHSDVLDAAIATSLAQAQEVTVMRATIMKHSPHLIAKIAFDTSDKFRSAFNTLAVYDYPHVKNARTAKWRAYLRLQCCIYETMGWMNVGMYYYSNEGGDQIGMAVACARRGVTSCNLLADELETYYKTAPKTPKDQRPLIALVPEQLMKDMKHYHDKFQHMNSIATRDPVPAEVAPVERKSLAKATPFVMPERNEKFDDDIFAALCGDAKSFNAPPTKSKLPKNHTPAPIPPLSNVESTNDASPTENPEDAPYPSAL